MLADGLSMMERFNRTGSMLPSGVAYAIGTGDRLEFATYAQVKALRIERQAAHLKRLLAVEGPVRRAAFLWTFWTPGLGGFAYRGWWAYLRFVQQEDQRLRFDVVNDTLTLRAMQLFPCGVIPARENFDIWKESFAKQYVRPGRFRRQGLAAVWSIGDGWSRTIEPA